MPKSHPFDYLTYMLLFFFFAATAAVVVAFNSTTIPSSKNNHKKKYKVGITKAAHFSRLGPCELMAITHSGWYLFDIVCDAVPHKVHYLFYMCTSSVSILYYIVHVWMYVCTM